MSNDINRDFIIQHLYDIMTINLHIKNLEENINSLSSKKANLEQKILEMQNNLKNPPPTKSDSKQNNDSVIITIFSYIIGIVIGIPLCVVFWPITIAAIIIYLIVRCLDKKNKKEDKYETQKNEIEKYNEELALYNQSRENYKKEIYKIKEIAIPNLDKAIADLEKERNEGYKLLNEICDLNIIPIKYRNLCAVTFLYDFMSTSKLSLENAILSCDLDKIQSQFNTVIMQNMNKICLLTKINAKNGKMLEQNEEMLTKLNNIKRNTTGINTSLESIRESNEIIAKNTKVIAYCEAVNYINNNDIGLFDPYSPETISDFGLSHFRGDYK